MHPADIQAALKKKGITQKDLAIKYSVGEMAISLTINKKLVSDRLMRVISQEIGKDHREVFPEYYLAKPKRSTSKAANF